MVLRKKNKGFALLGVLLAIPIFATMILYLQLEIQRTNDFNRHQEIGKFMSQYADAVAGYMFNSTSVSNTTNFSFTGITLLQNEGHLPIRFPTNLGWGINFSNSRVTVHTKTSATINFGSAIDTNSNQPSALVAASIIDKAGSRVSNLRYAFIIFEHFTNGLPSSNITASIDFATASKELWLLRDGRDGLVIRNATATYSIDVVHSNGSGVIRADDVFLNAIGETMSSIANRAIENTNRVEDRVIKYYSASHGAIITKPQCHTGRPYIALIPESLTGFEVSAWNLKSIDLNAYTWMLSMIITNMDHTTATVSQKDDVVAQVGCATS